MNKYDSYNYWRGMKPCARIRVQRVGISPTAGHVVAPTEDGQI
jgi:hypothetical protein